MSEFKRVDIKTVDMMNPLKREHIGVLLATGDRLANRFGAELQLLNEPVNLSDAVVTGYFIKPDCETVLCEGVAEGSTVYVDLPASCYTQSGTFSLAIKVSSTEVTGTVRVIDGVVRLTQTDTLIDPGEVVPSLDELLAHIAEMDAAVEEAKKVAVSSIVPEASGAVVAMNDAAERDAVQIVSEIKPTADGVSAVNLTRTGRNMVSHLDYTFTQGNRATIVTDDLIDVTVASGVDYITLPAHLKAGVTYTICIEQEVYGRDESSTLPTSSQYGFVAAPSPLTVRAKANGLYKYVQVYTSAEDIDTKIRVYPNYGNSLTGSNGYLAACSRVKVMVVEGEYTVATAPAFEPCRKQTLTTTLPETVYGGTLDWTSGVLTVTHGADGTELAEPTTHQLVAQTVEMLRGSNALWSDTGDTSVVYVADTKLYIDTKFEALQNAILAMGANI